MTTKRDIQEALKSAMKEKNSKKADTLRGILTEYQYEEMKGVITDEASAVKDVLIRTVKKLREELEFAHKASKQEQIASVQAEIEITESFLPQQMSEAQLTGLIQNILDGAPSDGKNIGFVMKRLKELYAGQYDSKAASALVSSLVTSR